jgi:hypothetical protein
MCPVIDNPTSCKIHIDIHFLHARNMSAAESHCVLSVVHGQNVMSEGTVRQWCIECSKMGGQTNVHDEQ